MRSIRYFESVLNLHFVVTHLVIFMFHDKDNVVWRSVYGAFSARHPDFCEAGASSGLKPASLSIMAGLMHPFSRETVHVTSPDIFLHLRPSIQDISRLHALKFVLNIYETEPLAGLVRSRVIPTTEDTASDETRKEYTKNNVKTTYHPIGTAPHEDGGVIDAFLRLSGVVIGSAHECYCQ
ncbi:hypothetical protein K439DRAFT_819777 [Ramaria rubella]|nr:hypothetical protein K439DRAFT_1014865 [Ramaria rubella]KAF8574700.1 hypothetical protein K439DRAFT_819777 [Ramaria rubella]